MVQVRWDGMPVVKKAQVKGRAAVGAFRAQVARVFVPNAVKELRMYVVNNAASKSVRNAAA
ncbi:MAG TPA: hypothetical protein PLI87_16285 [bacterium]|nr:hypothetical protein [bacterium]